MDFNNSLEFVLHKTQRKLQNALHQQFKEYDITPEQWGMLRCLSKNEGVSPTDVAEFISKDKSNTIRIAAKLEKKGLVTYQPSLIDKRSYLIFITVKGTRLFEKLVPMVVNHNNQAMMGISEEELEKLKSLLCKIYHNV